MKIAIDLDKTIFSCPTPLYKLLNFAPPAKPPFTKLKYVKLQELKDKIAGKSGLNLFNSKKYIEEQNAIKIIQKWHDRGHTIVLLSSRPSISLLNEQALSWLEENNFPYDELMVACNNKPAFCREHGVDLLIDNHLSICNKALQNGTSALRYNAQEFSWNNIDEFCEFEL